MSGCKSVYKVTLSQFSVFKALCHKGKALPLCNPASSSSVLKFPCVTEHFNKCSLLFSSSFLFKNHLMSPILYPLRWSSLALRSWKVGLGNPCSHLFYRPGANIVHVWFWKQYAFERSSSVYTCTGNNDGQETE